MKPRLGDPDRLVRGLGSEAASFAMKSRPEDMWASLQTQIDRCASHADNTRRYCRTLGYGRRRDLHT